LIIGHYSTRYKNINLLVEEAKNIFPNTESAEDGEKYTVEQVREKE
jgi:ribonuclease Z